MAEPFQFGACSQEVEALSWQSSTGCAEVAEWVRASYHERWEIESAFDELKSHLRGRQITLRSKTPDLIRQEFYGLVMAHFAIRGLMHEAALKGGVDPDRLSFMHAVRVVRRKMTRFASLPPRKRSAFHERVLLEILDELAVSSRSRCNPRAVKRKMSNWPVRKRGSAGTGKVAYRFEIRLTPHPDAKRKTRAPKRRDKHGPIPTVVGATTTSATKCWDARGAAGRVFRQTSVTRTPAAIRVFW